MRGDHAPTSAFWKTMLPIDYADTSLTISTPETVVADLSGGKPVKLISIIVIQTNNTATVETIVLEITMAHPTTGVLTVYTWTLTGIASGVPSSCYFSDDLTGGDLTTVSSTALLTTGAMNEEGDQTHPFKAGSVSLIRVQQTTDIDITTASIEVNIDWEKLTAVQV